MRGAWYVAASVLAGLAACSDSGTDPAKADAADGGATDAAATDGGTTSDGDSGPTFCALLDPPAHFCVDFDDGATPSDVFTKVEGAKLEDKSLRAQSDGVTNAFVEQEADPSPQWSTVELGFSLRIDDQASDGRTIVARIGQHMTDVECRAELELQPSGLTLRGGADDVKLTKTIPKGKAARIVLSQQAGTDGGNVTASVTIDGQPALGAPVALSCASFPGPPRVTLGVIGGAGKADLRIDDIVFDGR